MMIRMKRWFGGFAALALLVSLGSLSEVAYADPQPEILPPGPLEEQPDTTLSGLWLVETSIQTADKGFYVLPEPKDAFSPTTVLCRKNCVLRIEVASQFWLVPEGQVAQMVVKVDDRRIGIKPYFNINVDPTTTGGTAGTRSFSWVREGLSPGEHTVDVEFRLSGLTGMAGAGYRTLTVEVYQQRGTGGFRSRSRGDDPVGDDPPSACSEEGEGCGNNISDLVCCAGLTCNETGGLQVGICGS